ncbi:MAG: ABC transporter ATP-binding protein [Burkholderiaceae bacterium]
MLKVDRLEAWYGDSHVLHGVSFNVKAGEVVSLLGRNGSGKTTTLRSIVGLMQKCKGSIVFQGRQLLGLDSWTIARCGIAFCPETRGIFSSLSVRENLLLPPVLRDGGMQLEELYQLFPNLKERLASRGTNLSGGEQQMLAIARILRTGAKFLLLDEPTEGLAPVIINQIAVTLRALKERGYTVLLVEQNFRFASRLADRHYVVEQGRVVASFDRADVGGDNNVLEKYLGV